MPAALWAERMSAESALRGGRSHCPHVKDVPVAGYIREDPVLSSGRTLGLQAPWTQPL